MTTPTGALRFVLGSMTVSLTAGLLQAAPAAGQVAPSETALSPVLVTGTRLPQSRDLIATSTTVLDQATIEARNAASTVDLLREVPGLSIVQPGGGAGIVSVYLRGCQPNYVLFLVDGVPANDSNDSRGGSFDVSTLAPGELSRIEVIRGPQSAIYGADALCGVINFITRPRADTPAVAVEAGGGLRGSYQGALSAEGPLLERGGYALRAGTADQGELVPGATFAGNQFNGKLVLDRGAGYDLTLHGRYATGRGTDYPDESGGPDHAVGSARDARRTHQSAFDLSGHVVVAPFATLEASASTYHHHVDYASPGVLAPDLSALVPPRGELSDLARNRGSADARLTLPHAFSAVVGADYQAERGDLSGYITVAPGFNAPDSYRLDRHTLGTFAELQYAGLPGAALSASLRHDTPSDTESHTTAKLGGVYSPDHGETELRAQWGQGFKEPSLWALGNALVGNPQLKTEQSHTAEIGIARHFDARRWRAELSVFENHFINLVDFDNTLFQFVNRSEVTSTGAELSVAGALSEALSASAQASYVDIDPKDSQIPLRQRPRWHGTAELSWHPRADWSLGASVLTSGPVYDFSFPAGGGLTLGGYSLVNATAEWRALPGLTARFAVDNVLNRHYYEAYGFAVAGISPRVSLRYAF